VRPDDWRPQPRLFVSYHGRSYPVAKKQFVIGRGALADLSLKDGAVSRAHAAVIWRSGRFFLKDLGSDNGIFYKGMQIDNKRIEDGDVFVLGQHELTFTIER
jgi:pSer/pThr/pTyr-binding forkhead associated (FHA) protein